MAIVLIGTMIAVYAMIRYDSSQNQSPQVLTATDETNSAILKALGFTVGYYSSILQVTGNQTFAYTNATAYMNDALQYIESMNPSWGELISMTTLNLHNNWFSDPSVSQGQLSVVYDLTDLGIYGINYTTSCSLGVQIFNSPNSNQVCLNVTQDLTEPLTGLGQQNFAFYFYNYSTSNWQMVNPALTPIIFTNGTYLINTPAGIGNSAFMVQVTDSRGIMVEASSYSGYNLGFTFGNQSINQNSPVIVELLQNGTMQCFGQDLVNTTQARPIPPVPVKALHLCQAGSTSDIPFQVEDWASQYQIPLGLTNNFTIFGNSQMIVFEVSPSVSHLTLWWNGSDTAVQPSAAYADTYFSADNSGAATLSNGNMTLQFSYPNGVFQVTATVGQVTSTADFMRINADHPSIGSGSPAYIIQKGAVRDIVQEESEWGGGVTNCPNVYSQMVITLPANATYYTYQLRLIFINSSIFRYINDISPIQLTTSVSQPQAMTENGTINGIPNVTNGTGLFFNYGFSNGTWTAHHWSQLINSGLQGAGIMFTDSANQELYTFDLFAGTPTGALNVNNNAPSIELDPVTSLGSVAFSTPLDVTWYGAVATFSGTNPIYSNSGNSAGLWPLVEQPPTITVLQGKSTGSSITLSPNIGRVGTPVTVSGCGFNPDSPITITYDGKIVAKTVASSSGIIPPGITFNVPASVTGSSYTVSATDIFANSASATFTVGPIITLTPNRGIAGSNVEVTGAAFAANSSIAISFDGVNLNTTPATITSSSAGGFSATFVVPLSSSVGLHTVVATDGTSYVSKTFTVIPSNFSSAGYSYERIITVQNNVGSTLKSGYTALLTMDTSSLIASGKMLPNENDLRIVYQDGSSLVELDRDVIGINTDSTQIYFKTQADIPANGAESNYIMYYGNPTASTPPDNRSNVYLWFDDFNRPNEADITKEAAYSVQTGGGTWSIQNNTLVNVGGSGDPNKLIITALGNVNSPVDMLAQIDVTSFAGGDQSRIGLSCCIDSPDGEGYCALFHQDTNSLDFLNDLRSWGTHTSFSWSTNTWYNMEFEVLNPASGQGQVKIWPVGTPEPNAWTVQGNFGGGQARNFGELGFGGSRNSDTTYFKNITIRYVTSQPPTVSLGSEKNLES